MIDSNCHIKLTDFGISEVDSTELKEEKQEGERCFGTLEYLAPEILAGEPYGKEVDFWALACIIFQLLSGQTPFFENDIETTRQNIEDARIIWPLDDDGKIAISAQAVDLITNMLRRDPEERLGFISIDEIKSHAFFRDIDFNTIRKKPIKIGLHNQLDENEKPKEEAEEDKGDHKEEELNTDSLEHVRFDLLYQKNLDLVDESVRAIKKVAPVTYGIRHLLEDLIL